MHIYDFYKDSTDKTIYVMLRQDEGATNPGNPLTGLAYNTASLVAYYTRTAAAATAITLATQTVTGSHSDGGFVEVSSTNAPGLYRLDLPDAVLATGVDMVNIVIKGATDLLATSIIIQLYDQITSGNPQPCNVVQFGGSAGTFSSGRPEVNTTHIGGTVQTANDVGADVDAILVDTGTTLPGVLGTPAGADLATDIAAIKTDSAAILVDTGTTLDANITAILADTNELQTDLTNGGRLDLLIDAVKAKTDSLTFTVANQVDANVQSINDVTITGDGGATPFDVA